MTSYCFFGSSYLSKRPFLALITHTLSRRKELQKYEEKGKRQRNTLFGKKNVPLFFYITPSRRHIDLSFTKIHRSTKLSDIQRYKKIDQYILSKYLVTFLMAMALIIVIVITFDVSEKLDDFLSTHAPFSAVAFEYYLNFIPGFINLYSALFIFISVIFFTSKMAGNTEIIAILGSGISYNRMMRPFLHGSIIIALVVFILGNCVLPISNEHLIAFDKKYIHTRHDNYYNNIHFQQKIGTQVYVDNFDIQNMVAHQFHRDTYNEKRELIESETAESIRYDTITGKWICYSYFHRSINGKNEVLTKKNVGTIDLGLVPDDFNQKSKPIETMNSIELYKHIQHEKMRGSKNVIGAQIELNQRLFNPLAIIIMTIIAVAVSSRKTRGGIGMHLAIGISLAFAFVVFMKITTVFATNGNLPPVWAILLPQLVFGVASVFLVRNAPK